MNVWIWDASAPACNGCGVTDDEGGARRAVERYLTDNPEGTARLEKALISVGHALTSGYTLTGEGWTARREDGVTTWTPLGRELALS